jgi:hypothetical protein
MPRLGVGAHMGDYMLLPRYFRPWLLAPTVALTLLFGACSGSSEEAAPFARDYRRLTSTYQQEATGIQERAALVSGQGVDGILSVYQEILTSTQEARDGLDNLEPPADFQATYEDLLAVLDHQVDSLTTLVDSAEERDIPQVTAAAQELVELNSEWELIQAEMDELLARCGEPCD